MPAWCVSWPRIVEINTNLSTPQKILSPYSNVAVQTSMSTNCLEAQQGELQNSALKEDFFSGSERSEGEGKGKEEEGKGEREREIGSEALAERDGKNRKRPSRETNPGPQQTRLMLYHCATETSDITSQFPGWGVCDLFCFCQSFTSNFPFPFCFPFLFLSLSLSL